MNIVLKTSKGGSQFYENTINGDRLIHEPVSLLHAYPFGHVFRLHRQSDNFEFAVHGLPKILSPRPSSHIAILSEGGLSSLEQRKIRDFKTRAHHRLELQISSDNFGDLMAPQDDEFFGYLFKYFYEMHKSLTSEFTISYKSTTKTKTYELKRPGLPNAAETAKSADWLLKAMCVPNMAYSLTAGTSVNGFTPNSG